MKEQEFFEVPTTKTLLFQILISYASSSNSEYVFVECKYSAKFQRNVKFAPIEHK